MFRLLFGSFLKPNSPLYSSEYIEYLVRVTKPSVDGTLLSIISQNHSTPVPLSLVVIIFRALPVNEITLEKKNNFHLQKQNKYLFFSSLQNERFHKVLDETNSNTSLFNKLHEMLFQRDSRKTLLDIHSNRFPKI